MHIWKHFEVLSAHTCFGGRQFFLRHHSREIDLPMRVAVYLPPNLCPPNQLAPGKTLIYLAGLTCSEETFVIKAGAQRVAAELGMVLIAPDTSPRGTDFPGQSESWDFGVAAGFYLDALQQPWAKHWRMESYLLNELLTLLGDEHIIDPEHIGITGHSMGGHGALTLALRHPDRFRSVSALAPICAPSQCAWGRKVFSGYLGTDQNQWLQHDASALMSARSEPLTAAPILIDQGLDDQFLADQLHPHLFERACELVGQTLQLRRHVGYDHGYYFVSSFIESHLHHHANWL